MQRQIYDFPAFRKKIHNSTCGIYHTTEKRGVVYYFKDGRYVASAHERKPTTGDYSQKLKPIMPKTMWSISHQRIVDSIEALYDVYCDEIENEWLIST